ncbi:siderophore-interacting protein [Salinibacterium sp. ZJ450]|uniref:siderophore-interacting protein n=1 Tax=Salinibacterium sp. ZJ450 TaxID=2708338 RepID=UPI0014227B0D|nr:siderophore-interacting protein [Salinibacterium sp. ZJ450]
MLTLSPVVVKDTRPGYRPFRASVTGLTRLSPHFMRVTFSGPDFDRFGTAGLDQRIKIVLPIPGLGLSDFGADDADTILAGDWYARWRQLPDDARNPFRTYTVRAVRPQRRELDVDMVIHPDASHAAVGPAAEWLASVRVGDEVVIIGPDSGSFDSDIGIDWHPGDATEVLLAGDETAAPAICSVLETLPAGVTAHAFIEVPDVADRLSLDLTPGCTLTWLDRSGGPVGSALEPAVRDWVSAHASVVRPALTASAQSVEDVDVDTQLLWDSPAESHGQFYAWLAGEAAMIKILRRFLVSETGIDRRQVAFMGYWRHGKAEAQ